MVWVTVSTLLLIFTNAYGVGSSLMIVVLFLVATDSGSTSDPKTKHAGNNNPSLLNEKVEDWLKEHECYVSKQYIHSKIAGHLAHKRVQICQHCFRLHGIASNSHINIAMPVKLTNDLSAYYSRSLSL